MRLLCSQQLLPHVYVKDHLTCRSHKGGSVTATAVTPGIWLTCVPSSLDCPTRLNTWSSLPFFASVLLFCYACSVNDLDLDLECFVDYFQFLEYLGFVCSVDLECFVDYFQFLEYLGFVLFRSCWLTSLLTGPEFSLCESLPIANKLLFVSRVFVSPDSVTAPGSALH